LHFRGFTEVQSFSYESCKRCSNVIFILSDYEVSISLQN